jgi:geranylgeranylglycerol-phosphate geranylgeranyltransferase
MAHLEMWRPYTLGYVGLVSLSGALLTQPDASGWRLLGAWASPTLGWLAGLYGGDYCDRHLDAIAKPHRPIPSGRVRTETAVAAMIVCVMAGAAIALSLNWRTLLLVGAAFGGGAAYSVWLKGSGLSGNLVRGALTAVAFVFGTMAVTSWPPGQLLPVAMIWWLQDSGSNLVGTLRDAAGDRRGGYQTLVVRHGEKAALRYVYTLYGLAAGLAVASLMALPSPDRRVAIGLGAAAIACACEALVLLATSRRPILQRTALRAHEVLVVERVLLAGAMMALAAPVLALVLTAATESVTLVSQRTMRERYEFGRLISRRMELPGGGGRARRLTRTPSPTC